MTNSRKIALSAIIGILGTGSAMAQPNLSGWIILHHDAATGAIVPYARTIYPGQNDCYEAMQKLASRQGMHCYPLQAYVNPPPIYYTPPQYQYQPPTMTSCYRWMHGVNCVTR